MKKICQYAFFVIGLLAFNNASSQNALFLNQGTITFEKTTNVLAILKESVTQDNVWGEKMVEAYEKSNNPSSVSSDFTLAFNEGKTLFSPLEGAGSRQIPMSFAFSAATDNIVYTDLDSAKSITFKNVFDDSFLVRDSLRKIQWKITDETRTIAGFQCRRANALVMDSIYVVAFYTDMIPTSGGPESFEGLPGMILGLALPHKHMSWFATKVSVSPAVDPNSLVPPEGKRKTETVTRKELFEKMNKRMKAWGKEGNMIMQNALL